MEEEKILINDEHEIPFNSDSFDLLLSTAKSEYENEHNRTTILDTKTSISLPLISALFLAIAQINNYRGILNLPITNFTSFLKAFILFVTYSGALCFSLVAVILFVQVISTKKYTVLKPLDLYDKAFLKYDKIVLATKLIELYIKAQDHNNETNNSRIIFYQRGWVFASISIISYVFYAIFNNITGG